MTDTIPALLKARASDCSNTDAIVDHQGRLTYAELDGLSRERAIWLVAQGINKGQRVGLLMANGCDWAINAYAIMRIGATLVPLSTLLRGPELREQLELAGVRHLIATEAFRGRDYRQELATFDLQATLPSLVSIHWKPALYDGGGQLAAAVADALSERVRPADEMVVIFSSGSSGTPKGVIHSHGGALRANAAGLQSRCINQGDRIYLPMPLFWVGGFSGGLISALNAGATLLTEATPSPEHTLSFLQAERATLFRGWPDQAEQLAAHPSFKKTDLSSLKPGSLEAMLPVQLRGAANLRANLFGMTETFGPFCGFPLDRDMPPDKENSCGQPFSDIELRIVHPDSGDEQNPGEIGLIQVRGRNMLLGICGQEREQTFTPDGWYCGGDLGRLDQDGFLYFAGRQDDMLKLKGVSLYPSEIAAIIESIDGVKRAFVSQIGDQPAIGAAIVPDNPDDFELETVQQLARERMSAFKIPSRWIVFQSLDELPTLPTGKPDKSALRTLLETDHP